MSSIKKAIKIKGFLLFLAFFIVIPVNIKGQDIYGGIIGGLNITTINSSNDSGLKLGFNIGGVAKYKIDERNRVSANIQFSTFGQQYSERINMQDIQVKKYYSTTLYYINIPIVYQYYFTDILGLEIGPRIGYCLGGKFKTKIGDESWQKEKLTNDEYNPLEIGIVVGVYTCDFSSQSLDNYFIGLRGFCGFTNVFKDSGHNVNMGIQISLGYIFDKPLK